MGDTPLAGMTVPTYFADRIAGFGDVETTTTPSGQVLDWIEPESQVKNGQIAIPPWPPLARPDEIRGMFELEDLAVGRGGTGRVPILRKQIGPAAATKSAVGYLSKPGRGRYEPAASVDLSRGFFHASLDSQSAVYGAEATLNVWQPRVVDTEDHSLMELWLVNEAGPLGQSVEAGWMVSTYQYGDPAPHLFTWFTTNGWGSAGPNIGGYDANQSGWVQVDDTIFPGAVLQQVSVSDGPQTTLSIKFMLSGGNWWFMAQGRWIGYYPGYLFASAGDNPTLSQTTTRVLFGGEVFSSNSDPVQTRTQMGSGATAEGGMDRSCFQANLRVQIDPAGAMQDLLGPVTIVDHPIMYDIASFCGSDSPLGSYCFVGGPGAQTTE